MWLTYNEVGPVCTKYPHGQYLPGLTQIRCQPLCLASYLQYLCHVITTDLLSLFDNEPYSSLLVWINLPVLSHL